MTANNYTTSEMAVKGSNTETLVKKWLSDNSTVYRVMDVSKNKTFQRLDVDVVITLKLGLEIQAEIKTDNNLFDTENFLYELQRIYLQADPAHTSTLGWSAKTPAEYIIWYSPKVEKIIVMRTIDYREAFQNYIKAAGSNVKFNTQQTTKNYCTTINVLFPKVYIGDKYTAYGLDEEMEFLTPDQSMPPVGIGEETVIKMQSEPGYLPTRRSRNEVV